jgi:RNA polymerase sigma-70 factor (ECF subfamily)
MQNTDRYTAMPSGRATGCAQPSVSGRCPVRCGHHVLEAATSGLDPRYHQRFVRETQPVLDFLIRNATRLTRQRADAEDLVQETLLKAYTAFDAYQEGTHLKSWLSRIMTNTWIDQHRSSQRRPVEQLSAEVPESRRANGFGPTGASNVQSSAESQALQYLPSDVEMALRALPDELREIVYYACIADYRNTEIAELLNIPVGTVGSRLHRGKALLREVLADPR